MTGPRPIPEGAEESVVVREAVRRQNLVRAQKVHMENRRLRERLQAAGLDPDAPVDVLAVARREEAA